MPALVTHTRPYGGAGWFGQAFCMQMTSQVTLGHRCLSLLLWLQEWITLLTGHTFSALTQDFLPFFPWGAQFSVFQVQQSQFVLWSCLLLHDSHFFPIDNFTGTIRMKELLAMMEIIHQHTSPRKWYNLLNSQRLHIFEILKLELWKTWDWMMK